MASPGGVRPVSPASSSGPSAIPLVSAPLPTAPVAFSSDELNYLVYRYLLESGFEHSGFVFGNESDVLNRLAGNERLMSSTPAPVMKTAGNYVSDDPDDLKYQLEGKERMLRMLQAVQQGALVSIVQKGLQYVEVETHLNEVGSKCLMRV